MKFTTVWRFAGRVPAFLYYEFGARCNCFRLVKDIRVLMWILISGLEAAMCAPAPAGGRRYA